MVEVFCLTLEEAGAAAQMLAAQAGAKVKPLGSSGFMVVDSKGVVLAQYRLKPGMATGGATATAKKDRGVSL